MELVNTHSSTCRILILSVIPGKGGNCNTDSITCRTAVYTCRIQLLSVMISKFIAANIRNDRKGRVSIFFSIC